MELFVFRISIPITTDTGYCWMWIMVIPPIMGVKAQSIVGETVNVMSDVLDVVAYTGWTVTAKLQDTIGALSAPGRSGSLPRRLSIQ